MRALLLGALVSVCLGESVADDKKADSIDVKKLEGRWELKQKAEDARSVFEFMKDGKLLATHTTLQKTVKAEGTYRVDGSKLTTTLKTTGKDLVRTYTVSKLSDTELVLSDETGMEQALVPVGID